MKTTKALKGIITGIAAVWAVFAFADAPVICHWTGAAGNGSENFACWTNPANWAEGVVPGRFVTCADYYGRIPTSGEVTTNGSAGCIAVFDRACGFSTIGLQGLVSISNIVVSGADAPALTFGHINQESPALTIEFGGGIFVDSAVPVAPVVVPKIMTCRGGISSGGTVLSIRNDSDSDFIWGVYGGPEPALTTWAGHYCIRLEGTGRICKRNKIYYSNFEPVLHLAMSGGSFVGDYASCDTWRHMESVAGAGAQSVTVNAGKLLALTSGDIAVRAREDVSIGGAGVLRLTNVNGSLCAHSGRRIEISCAVEHGRSDGGIWIGQHSWENFHGTTVLSGANTFSGPVRVCRGATLELPEFGAPLAAGPLGKGNTLSLNGNAKICYTGGAGELKHTLTMDGNGRFENMGGQVVVSGGVTGTGTLTVGGTGETVFASSVASPLVLERDVRVRVADGETVTLSSVTLNDSVISVETSGSGRLVMPSLPAGRAPDGIRVNGMFGVVGEDGTIASYADVSADVSIDAHGGTVPAVSGKTVSIDSADGPESEKVSLGSALTEVGVLRQNQSVDKAVVAMNASDSLAAGVIVVSPGAKPLELSAAGAATVAGIGGAPVELAPAAGAAIELSGPLSLPCAALRGGGTVKLGGDIAEARFIADDKLSGPSLTAAEGEVAPLDMVAITGGGSLEFAGGDFLQRGVSADAVSHPNSTPVPSLCVGSNGVGVLRFSAGSFQGRMFVSGGQACRGAVYQTGGTVVNVTQYGEQGTETIGKGGFGYYELTGGKFIAAGSWYIGSSGAGVLAIHGGTVEQLCGRKGNLSIGAWDGAGVVDVRDGGSLVLTNKNDDLKIDNVLYMPYYGRYASTSVLTVDDGGSVDIGRDRVIMAVGTTTAAGAYCHSVINLNGGVFSADAVTRHSGHMAPDADYPDSMGNTGNRKNIHAFVNFDGGTFRKSKRCWGDIFGSAVGDFVSPSRITVYGGGAVIDSNGMDCRLGGGAGAALTAPTGKGVKAVPLDAPITGVIGSPYVEIKGDGTGATAYAQFDQVSGAVVAIRVTSPGNDYTAATAEVKYGSDTLASIVCELGECASGGLTKRGSGTLEISAVNTYTGATVIENGVLKLRASNLISSASELVLAGGTLDLNGFSQTFSGYSPASVGGAITNGTVTLSALRVDMADIRAGRVATIPANVAFAPGAAMSVTGFLPEDFADAAAKIVIARFADGVPAGCPETLDAASAASLPRGWVCRISGSRAVIYRRRMTSVIVR